MDQPELFLKVRSTSQSMDCLFYNKSFNKCCKENNSFEHLAINALYWQNLNLVVYILDYIELGSQDRKHTKRKSKYNKAFIKKTHFLTLFISLVKPGFTAVNDLPYVTLYRTNHFVFRCYHLLYSLCIRIHYFCLCKYARGTFVSLFPFRHIICRETRSASSDLKLRDFSHYLYNISRPRSRNTFRHVPSEGIRLLYWLSYKQFPAGLLFHVN